jgi:tetratricopeptide (TPR) repeat protein
MNLTYDALQEALARIENTTPTERALIEALEARYVRPFPEDRSHLDQAYADAMREVWERFPDDPDVGFLFAESLMILSPWALYDRESLVPTENTGEIVATLERVMELNPNHPGACHAFIHAVEQSATPERALPAADRLCELTPVIPHMVHMPSHIYLRTDQWDRAVEQNLLAAEADERYFGVRPVRTFDYASNIHNNHIAAWSAMMTGREEIAIRTSRRMWDSCPEEIQPIAFAVADSWMCSLYDAQKRFGRWDDLLAEPAPPESMPITTCMWRANRAVAYAAKKDFAGATAELERFRQARERLPEDPSAYYFTTPESVQQRMDVVEHFVPGEIALQRGDWDEAIAHLERAVEAEDLLGFGGEPPAYLQPIRHTLGAVYMKAGRFADAERVYREDQREYAGNGWSLYGLARALEAQSKADDATAVEASFQTVWQHADEELTTSCKCIEAIAVDG